MRIQPDDWLAAVLARPVFAVHEVGGGAAAVAAAVEAHAAGRPGAFYFARVPADAIESVAALTAAGFGVIEASVTLARRVDEPIVAGEAGDGVRVVTARPEWRDAIVDVAGTAFRYSRFHLDPGIGHEAADRVKREWVRNCVEGRRGDRVLVALDGGTPVGFLTLLVARRADGDVGVIDLVAVHPDRQGRRIGERLVAGALEACRGRTGTLEVGTQTVNVPSLRLYERTGFRVVRTGFALHRHVAP